jgi:3-oxoacyl-[acyl-carrier protein] reductase
MTVAGDLAGKTILITGAASGIGAALAEGFGRVGCRVVVHYHRNESGAQKAAAGVGERSVVVQADLSQRGAADELIAHVVETAGPVDILVNNAGTMVRRAGVLEMDDKYFYDVLNINLYSTVSCTRAVMPQMLKRRSGAIINVTSVAARTGGGAGAGLYGAAKAAVATYTKSVAREVAREGIRVNAISPGVILTRFHEQYSTQESLAKQIEGIPQGRAGAPSDIVGPAIFLASEAMSGHVTGQILEVNGGMYSP